MNKKLTISVFLSFSLVIGIVSMNAQEKEISIKADNQKPYGPINYLGCVGDGVVFFWENDPPEPNNNGPVGYEGIVLAPITEKKEFEFETGRVTLPGVTIKSFLEMRIYVRQRYFYCNDGQDFFRARTLPIIELESPVFNDLTNPYTGEPLNGKITYSLNGIMLNACKTLVEGELGADSRGNFRAYIWTEEYFDAIFGKGIGKEVFRNDLTIIMRVKNWVLGLNHFVIGTMTELYVY